MPRRLLLTRARDVQLTFGSYGSSSSSSRGVVMLEFKRRIGLMPLAARRDRRAARATQRRETAKGGAGAFSSSAACASPAQAACCVRLLPRASALRAPASTTSAAVGWRRSGCRGSVFASGNYILPH